MAHFTSWTNITNPRLFSFDMRAVLYVLVACEESQAECLAFRELGHIAFSCDLQPARYKPQWHILGDVSPLLRGETSFDTQDGEHHDVPRWDLIVAHPPCTYLCRVSSVHMVKNGIVDADRYDKMLQARDFFFKCLAADAPYVAVENPIPMKRARLPRPSCYTQPYWFGVKYTKKTLWWLKNLPAIFPQYIYPDPKEFVHNSRGKYRSRTFPQVARACAEQWTAAILDDLEKYPR